MLGYQHFLEEWIFKFGIYNLIATTKDTTLDPKILLFGMIIIYIKFKKLLNGS